jgi:hypothetical protein
MLFPHLFVGVFTKKLKKLEDPEKKRPFTNQGLQDVNPNTTTFAWITPNITDPNIFFKLGHRPSLLDIFLRFVPKELIDQIIKKFTTGDLLLRQSSGWVLVPTLWMVYIALAFSIRTEGKSAKSETVTPIDS